jgi:hypothetical protein
MTYPRDDEFYARDRPAHPTLPEDRPRGGKDKASMKHRGPWAMAALIAFVILLILVGIALFP